MQTTCIRSLLAAHGTRLCLSVRNQPPTATGALSQTSTIPYHASRGHLLDDRGPIARFGLVSVKITLAQHLWMIAPWEQGPSYPDSEDF